MQRSENDRLAALRASRILDTAPEAQFDRITAMAGDLFDAPIALVSLIDEDRQWFKSRVGLPVTETRRAGSFCEHAVSLGPDKTLVVLDATLDPRFATNHAVVGMPGIRFYAGATLSTRQGDCLGTLCVIDTKPRTIFADREVERLKMLARFVIDAFEARDAAYASAHRLKLLELTESVSGVGRFRVDVASGASVWSDEVYKICGLDPSSFDPALDGAIGLFHPEDRPLVEHYVERSIFHQEDHQFQLRLIRSDGEVRHVISKAVCELDALGATAAINGIFQDVTEQVRSLDKVRRSEARYRLLADNVDDVITRIKVDGSSGYISPAIQRLLGYEAEEMRGKTAHAFVHPSDRPAVLKVYDDIAHGLTRKTLRHRALHKDGSIVWVETHFKRVEASDGPPDIIAVIHDITERKAAEDAVAASEARYRLITENATDGITRYTSAGTVLYISPSVETLTGLERDELLGRTGPERVHPEDVATYLEGFERARQNQQPVATFRYRFRHKAGHWIWLESNPRLVVGEALQLEFVDVCRDVTARVALDAELEQAKAEAEAAAVVKSEFVSNMSHELRTPLTSILGFSSLLCEEEGLSEFGRRAVARLEGAGQALLTIVNDILDFSRLEAGQVQIDPRPVDPSAVLNEALELLEPQAQAKGLELCFCIDGDLPPSLSLDDARVRQILLNLIGNAVKFTTIGGVRLAASYDAARERLRCAVIDTGPGVAADKIEQLFRRFSQVDASTTRAFGGTGLGLAICKGLVEAMGGEIGMTSVPGEGAVAWFELPSAPTFAICSAANDAQASVNALAGMRLLVADDNAMNQELIRLLLGRYEVEITEAHDGVEAIGAAEEAPFDLILMDLRMPRMDGRAAARAIRQGGGANAGVPIIAFSADATDGRAVAKERQLFDDYLSKPVSAQNLIATCEHWTSEGAMSAEAEHG